MSGPLPPDEIISHYERVYDEMTRLTDGGDGAMEATRTLEMLDRFLPAPQRPVARLTLPLAEARVRAGYEQIDANVLRRHVIGGGTRGLEDAPRAPRVRNQHTGELQAEAHPA